MHGPSSLSNLYTTSLHESLGIRQAPAHPSVHVACSRPSLVPSRPCPPGGERLVVWFQFLFTNTILIWNVRWAIKLNQLKVPTSSKCKMVTPILFQGLQFLCERENTVYQRPVLLRTGLQPTYLRCIKDWLLSLKLWGSVYHTGFIQWSWYLVRAYLPSNSI